MTLLQPKLSASFFELSSIATMAPDTTKSISATPAARRSRRMFFLSIISIAALVSYSYVAVGSGSLVGLNRFVVSPDSAVGVVRTTTFHTANDTALQILTEHDNGTMSTHYFGTPNEKIAFQHSANSATTSETVASGNSKTKSKDKSSRTATTSTSSNIKEKQHDRSEPSRRSASSRTVGYFGTPNKTIALRHSVNSSTTSETVTSGSSKTKSKDKSNRTSTTSTSSNPNEKQHDRSDPSRSASSRTVSYFDIPNETIALRHSLSSNTTSETVASGSNKTKSKDTSSRMSTTSASSTTKEMQHDRSEPSRSSAGSRTVGTTGSSSRSTTLFIANTSNISSSLLSSSSLLRMIDIERERPSYKKTCYFEYDALPIGLGMTYDVSVIYHVGMLNNWRSIMLDQFHTLEICGLGYMTSDLTISFSNPSANTTEGETVEMLKEVLYQFPFMNKNGHNNNTMSVTFINASQAFPYEKPILEHIGMVCRRHHRTSNKKKKKKKIVFYFHSKGSSKYVEKNIAKMKDTEYRKKYKQYGNVFYWRKYMEWFLLEKPTLCIRTLLFDRQSKACGVNLNYGPIHYSGNFWASTCHHIKDLRIGPQWPLRGNRKNFQYISAELWIGNYKGLRPRYAYQFVNLFAIDTSLYRHKALPAKYEWIISKQEFLRINSSSYLKKGFDYYFTNQTDLWLDYLNGTKGLTSNHVND